MIKWEQESLRWNCGIGFCFLSLIKLLESNETTLVGVHCPQCVTWTSNLVAKKNRDPEKGVSRKRLVWTRGCEILGPRDAVVDNWLSFILFYESRPEWQIFGFLISFPCFWSCELFRPLILRWVQNKSSTQHSMRRLAKEIALVKPKWPIPTTRLAAHSSVLPVDTHVKSPCLCPIRCCDAG